MKSWTKIFLLLTVLSGVLLVGCSGEEKAYSPGVTPSDQQKADSNATAETAGVSKE